MNSKNKAVYTVSEVAGLLGVSLPIAYQLAKSEGFPSIRISNRRLVIPAEALTRWLDDQVGFWGV